MGLIDVLGRRRTYLDANIFIYAVEGFAAYEGALRRLFEAVDRGELSIATSELTLAEVLVGPVKEGKREAIKAYSQAIQARRHFEVLPVSRQVLFQAAMIRAKYARMKLPDAVHIATAEQHGYPAFLTNDKNLKNIAEVEVIQLARVVDIMSK